MAFVHNDLSGSLFNNDRKNNDRQPDMNGSCKIEGEDYWVSAWIKQSSKGEYLSLAFTAKDAPHNTQTTPIAKSCGNSFLKKTGQLAEQKKDLREESKTKFERDKAEFEAATGARVPFEEEFDDDIPF